MRKLLVASWFTILVLSPIDVLACPCSVDKYHILSCNPDSITNFPEDILESCSIQPDEILAIELMEQPLSRLESRAFLKFPNLLDLVLSINDISFVAHDAFYGLTHLHNLLLGDNNITQFAKGTFDDLVSLKSIDVRGNDYLDPTYVTSAWHMCHRETNGLIVQGDLTFYKDLQMSETTELYCEHLLDIEESSGICLKSKSTVDCRGLGRIEDGICFLKKWAGGSSFTNILFDFPVDAVPIEVEDFFEGESNAFFQEFNSFKEQTESELSVNQIVKNLTFYSTIFDLSELPKLTSRKTKEVTIWADTIVISAPITISYKTTIRARKVSFNHMITMNITTDLFLDSSQEVEIWTMKEEHITIKGVVMRQRKFGLLDILDEIPKTHLISNEKCNPLPKDAIKERLDISSWFDFTHLNLMYLSARTIHDSKKNARLVGQITNFTLDYTFYSILVNNKRTYSAARKFKQLEGNKNVHIVPSYSVDKVQELAEVMHSRMQDYRLTELAQEQQIQSARSRIEDMQVQFDIIEAEQEEYFSMEMIQLEALWAATDMAWNFSTEHREKNENNIGTAMDAMMNQTFEMRDKELVQMMKEAIMSQEHIQDVIDKYQIEIERIHKQAKGSFKVQIDLFKKLINAKITFYREMQNFENAIIQWEMEETEKAVYNFFSGIVGFFTGSMGSYDQFDVIKKLAEVYTVLEKVEKMIDDLNLDDLTDISMNFNTDFTSALDEAVDIKLKGPAFDNVAATAKILLDDMNQATDHGIEHTTDLMMALQSIADLGCRMVGEIAEFAIIVLSLAEKNDELLVAQNDMERAHKEVEEIENMIEDFQKEKDDFYSEREKSKQDYENEIEKMREDYENMTAEMREKYKNSITEKFNEFKLTFSTITDSYNNRISSLIESIQQKNYGLKKHSINQRNMIYGLFMDFCDSIFFHSFDQCTDSDVPLISDDFENLLEKLLNIEWDSITSDDAFPPSQRPQPFDFMYIDVTDDLEGFYYPIQIFKNESRLEVNLKDFDTLNGFAEMARIRIKKIQITLYDENHNLIASPGETGQLGGDIKVRITHPTIFFDQDWDKVTYPFIGHNFFCNANYWTHPDLSHNACQVDAEFSPSQYETTPDGIFTIEIKNADKIKMNDINSIRVEFSGTYIPFLKKKYISM